MRNVNLDNVQEATERTGVKPGGYLAVIKLAEDVPEKEYIRLELDIAEGEYKGYYDNLYRDHGFWGLSAIRSYKEKALPFFKAFITAVEKSNAAYKFDYNEKTLVGKAVGIVLSEEEYRKSNGDVGTRLCVHRFTETANIRTGNFKVPEKKTLEPATAPTPPSADVEYDLPF